MRHRVKTKKFDRHAESRKALKSQLAVGFFKANAIETTLEKAKYVKPFIERIITKAKKNDLASRRYLIQKLQDKEVVNKLLEIIGPTFLERNGGYTRIQRTKVRKGDAGQMAKLSFVVDLKAPKEKSKEESKDTKTKIKSKTKKVEKKETE